MAKVPDGVSLCAPCRNRTYNLMIKSQLRASDLARTEGVYLGFQATNDAELVPPTHPKEARRFHGSIPELGSHGVSQLSRVRQKSSIETAVRHAGRIEHMDAWTVTDSPPLKAKGPLLDLSPVRSFRVPQEIKEDQEQKHEG